LKHTNKTQVLGLEVTVSQCALLLINKSAYLAFEQYYSCLWNQYNGRPSQPYQSGCKCQCCIAWHMEGPNEKELLLMTQKHTLPIERNNKMPSSNPVSPLSLWSLCQLFRDPGKDVFCVFGMTSPSNSEGNTEQEAQTEGQKICSQGLLCFPS
jgi:hypothetical protein